MWPRQNNARTWTLGASYKGHCLGPVYTIKTEYLRECSASRVWPYIHQLRIMSLVKCWVCPAPVFCCLTFRSIPTNMVTKAHECCTPVAPYPDQLAQILERSPRSDRDCKIIGVVLLGYSNLDRGHAANPHSIPVALLPPL